MRGHSEERKKKMATYSEYTNTKGTFWLVKGYLGIDEATGKQVTYEKRGFKRKKDAQHSYRNAKHQFMNGAANPIKKSKIKFNQLYHEWLEVYSIDVRESTLNKTKTDFRVHILPEFEGYYIDKISPSHVQKAVTKWHKKLVKYKQVFNQFKRVMAYAVKNRYIKENPCDFVEVPKKAIKKHDKATLDYYTKGQLQSFIKALEQMETRKWHAFFRLLSFTGIRRGEALALQWKDIDFKNEEVSINKALALGESNKLYIGDPKNENSKRLITIDKITLKVLKQWKREQAETLIGFGHNALDKDQFIFSKLEDNTPLHLTAPRNALSKICDRFNLPMINIHGFRHTHCTLLFEAGVPIKDVMDRMGHSDIQTTMNIYTHVTQSSKDKSAELFSNYANF